MLVPYKYNGPGSDQSQDVRLLQLGQHSLVIKQDQKASGQARRALQEAPEARIEWPQDEQDDVRDQAAAQKAGLPGSSRGLHNVGYVMWQSGFVLAELLLRHPPFRAWHGVSVVDLGTGTGVVRRPRLATWPAPAARAAALEAGSPAACASRDPASAAGAAPLAPASAVWP
jgi:predicted nicotinamide N-methyase